MHPECVYPSLSDRAHVISAGYVAACPLCQAASSGTSIVRHVMPLPVEGYEDMTIEKILGKTTISAVAHAKRYLGEDDSAVANHAAAGIPASPMKSAPMTTAPGKQSCVVDLHVEMRIQCFYFNFSSAVRCGVCMCVCLCGSLPWSFLIYPAKFVYSSCLLSGRWYPRLL